MGHQEAAWAQCQASKTHTGAAMGTLCPTKGALTTGTALSQQGPMCARGPGLLLQQGLAPICQVHLEKAGAAQGTGWGHYHTPAQDLLGPAWPPA